MTTRRLFLTKASSAMAAAAAVTNAPHVIAQPKIQWRMSTAWTPALDVNQGAAKRLAKVVEEMSKAYDALPVDLQRMLDHAAAAVHSYGHADFHEKNALALQRLKTLQLPAPVLRDLKKLSAEVVREESEKTPMARKVHASFTKFQALGGPVGPRRGEGVPPAVES